MGNALVTGGLVFRTPCGSGPGEAEKNSAGLRAVGGSPWKVAS